MEGGLQLRLWNLNSAYNSPVASHQLSCQISTNQWEAEPANCRCISGRCFSPSEKRTQLICDFLCLMKMSCLQSAWSHSVPWSLISWVGSFSSSALASLNGLASWYTSLPSVILLVHCTMALCLNRPPRLQCTMLAQRLLTICLSSFVSLVHDLQWLRCAP